MLQVKTPSFTVEFPLKVTPSDAPELGIRMEMHRQIYNACLGEALKRLKLMRESKAYQKARKLSKGAERTKTFNELCKLNKFTEFDVAAYGTLCQKKCQAIKDHTTSQDVQVTSSRAFKAVQQYSFGGRGKPKFKKFRELNSIEGKQDCCITFRAENGKLVIKWKGLVLPLIVDPTDNWLFEAITEHRNKYVRLLRRNIKGKDRWFAQLLQEGISPRRPNQTVGADVVGLDMGPSTIAAVSSTNAIFETLCPKVVVPEAEIRRIQRRMDRSKRKNNPDAFNENGTYKKGAKINVRSKSYLKDLAFKAEKERKLAAERKRAHGELTNRILAQGKQIKTENVSYLGWQKSRYGKSIGKRAPAMFIALLKRKAESVGGSVIEFSTHKTKLSQVDHTTGLYTKKPLSQRKHIFPDGSEVQRDLYSAYLARFVNDDSLDISQATAAWASSEPILRRAVSRDSGQSVRGEGFDLPHIINNGVRTACTRNPQRTLREVVDVVTTVQAVVRATKNAKKNASRRRSLSTPPAMEIPSD